MPLDALVFINAGLFVACICYVLALARVISRGEL